MLRFVLFDLDDTLYAAQCGLWAAIGERIELYMKQRLGLADHVVGPLRRRYLESFGTTLNGLRAEHHIDPLDYLAFVRDLPLERYLQPDAALDGMLARLPLTKVVFTNADAAHAQRVLGHLGIAHHFARIIDIHALSLVNKPQPAAYRRALDMLGARPAECVFVDDARRNLPPARALGMLTVLVSAAEAPDGSADYVVGSVLDVERVLRPHLGAPPASRPAAAQDAA
jgi:putative hydrolase of the HAD superfamily